jgi:hypothetical protein
MDAGQVIELVWMGVAMLLIVLILVTRRARRHGGALRAAVIGAMYECQTKDKQRALDVIVQGKAAAQRPEYPDGSLPDPHKPGETASPGTRKPAENPYACSTYSRLGAIDGAEQVIP